MSARRSSDTDNSNPATRITESEMLRAVSSGDVERIDSLIATGTDPNDRFESRSLYDIFTKGKGNTYLIEAVLSRQAESVKAVLRGGADVNASRQRDGMSPLHVASEEGFTDIVRILLENGADVESKDNEGCTPLFHAVDSGHVDVVKLLIGDGVKSLLDYRGANVEAENFKGKRPIHCAVKRATMLCGHDKLVQLLIKHGANVDAADINGDRPLHDAVRSLHLNVVQLLVRHGAELNVQNIRRETPLHIAIERQQPEVIMFLLSQDADVGLTDVRRNTPIHYITSELSDVIRDKEFTEYFTKIVIKKHQHLFVRKLFGVSPITHAIGVDALKNAIYVRSEKFLAKLLTYVDCHGNTPLHYALYGSDLEFVEFLLKGGADINAQNKEGRTPLHVVLGTCNSIAIKVCLQYANDQSFAITDKRGRNFWHLLFLLVTFYGLEDVLNECLLHVRDVSSAQSVDYLNRTPLHYACMRRITFVGWKDVEIFVNVMIGDEHINIQDKFKRTALHYAAIANDAYNLQKLLKFLLTKKVNDSIEDMFGKTYKDYMAICEAHDRKIYHVWQLHDVKDFYGLLQKYYSADQFSDLLQVATKLRELREYSDRIAFVRNIYLGCRVDYADDDLLKELVSSNKRNQDTATQSTDMFAAIEDCVTEAMEYLAREISARDRRFACEVFAVGSSYEGTKIECCDEFDYNFVLTDLSRICRVSYSPESPLGFVLLKASTSEYDEDLFNCNGTLDTRAVKFKFETLIKQILSSIDFLKRTGLEFVEEVKDYSVLTHKSPPAWTKCNTCIKLSFTHPVNGHHVLHKISVDIVPALQIKDWWPDDARRQDMCQTGDCLIVFSQPQKKYPWVGWTEPHGFISFARAESRLLSRPVVKAAYMVVKWMSKYFYTRIDDFKLFSSHVIKTALLWCLDEEGFNACSSSGDNDEVNEDELLRLVQNILRRLMCFAAQDYLPSYFMPKCHQPVWIKEKYLKQFHIDLYQQGLTYKDLFILNEQELSSTSAFLPYIRSRFLLSHVMYWLVCTDTDTDDFECFFPSIINPLREISYDSDNLTIITVYPSGPKFSVVKGLRAACRS